MCKGEVEKRKSRSHLVRKKESTFGRREGVVLVATSGGIRETIARSSEVDGEASVACCFVAGKVEALRILRPM